MAVGCLSGLVEKGILIPDDMAIFGFDNISIARDSKPGFSSINLRITAVARKAIVLLMDQINHENQLSAEK